MFRCRRKWRWSKFRIWEAAEEYFPGTGWVHIRWRYDLEKPDTFYLMCNKPEDWSRSLMNEIEKEDALLR